MSKEDPILTISVASSLLKLHPRTLMLYEKTGFVQPHRTSTNRRLFSIKDLNKLQFIKHLSKNEGINLQGIKIILEAIAIAEQNNINMKKRLFPSFKAKKLI